MTEICNVSREQYKIIQNSDKGVKEVLYTYRFNRVYVNRFIIFPIVENKSDDFYIEKAKRLVEEEKKNGKFAKYSLKYIEDSKIVKRKKIALALIIPIVVCGLAVGGVYLTKFIMNLPIPEIGDAKAIEVSTNILSEQYEDNTMDILLAHTKTGKIEMKSSHIPYDLQPTLTETHIIDFDFANGEFYFKDSYSNSLYEDLNYISYYLYRETKGPAPSGVYNFYTNGIVGPDGTGTLENYGFASTSVEHALKVFAPKTLNKLIFIEDDFNKYNYEWHFLGTYPLLETSWLDPIKARVVDSQPKHPDSYITTAFRSDGRKSITTNLDFVYYNEKDERYYENFSAVITNKLCYECKIVTETGNNRDRRETTYKLYPDEEFTKDDNYKDWKLRGEEIF